MNLSKVKIKNFRRLANVIVDFDKELSIFVGANNSGKTSVAQALYLFASGENNRISFHDFNASTWSHIQDFQNAAEGATLPAITLDFWFTIDEANLHRVIDLLPSLEWHGKNVGIRVSYGAQNPQETFERFSIRYDEAQKAAESVQVPEGDPPYIAPPRCLREYLETELSQEYEFRYYVLDEEQFDDELEQKNGYEPQELLKEHGRSGKDILNSLIKVRLLQAQRHLSDNASGGRTEELSRHLSRFYTRNFARQNDDHNALRALAISEDHLNQHLKQVFAETIDRLSHLGYPGLSNPRVIIKSALDPTAIMNSKDGALIHYALSEDDDDGLTLPDKYNGLGFKNLIYMVVELLDYHAQWLAIEENRPPLQLIFIEEPETHLHAQLQQVFVNKIIDILENEENTAGLFRTQLVLTTHSPHILYERGFTPIRYFRRENSGVTQSSQILNLSKFYNDCPKPDSDFLQRYLKLTHCDLFFADAAILVEGNVERLLIPQMINKAAPKLKASYLSILEIGGAFGHQFKELINFLGIATLIITDLDSVKYTQVKDNEENPEDEDNIEEIEVEENVEDDAPKKHAKTIKRRKKTCRPEEENAETSNQMLIQWLPGYKSVKDLLKIEKHIKEIKANDNGLGAVRVTYPCTVTLEWKGKTINRAGRTLEAAFAFENLEWTQQSDNKNLNLLIRNPKDIEDIALRLHTKIHKDGFKKTDFALALLSKNPNEWIVPQYIAEGLEWLENIICPPVKEAIPPSKEDKAAA